MAHVKSRNSVGWSSASNEVTFVVGAVADACAQPLNTPSALSATVKGSDVTLAWRAPVGGCPPASYVFEVGSASGLKNLLVFSTGNPATSFSASSVASGMYYVRVRASNADLLSAPSNEVQLTVGPDVCGAPPSGTPSLTASVFGSLATLIWTRAAGASRYVLEAGSAPGASDLAVIDTGNASPELQATAGNGTYYVRVRGKNGCGLGRASNETTVTLGLSPTRSTFDRPDDVIGFQVKVMYVVPNDGADEQLDVNSTLTTTVEAWQRWLEQASGGQRVKLDTYQGVPDIAFYRLPQSDASIAALELTSISEIQSEIKAAGFNNPNKVYAVYYGGNNLVHCGQSLRTVDHAVAAAFLKGTLASSPGLAPCPLQVVPTNLTPGITRSPDAPGYWEYVMVHEVFHMLGAVPSCAPHASGPHVTDSPSDLMYAGSERWNPSLIDFNRDDYFQHGRATCLDVAKSPYLVPGF